MRPIATRNPKTTPEQAAFNAALGANIRRARWARCLKQKDLATAAGCWGPSLIRIEAGKQGVKSAVLLRIAAVLGMPPASLYPT